MSAPLHSRHFKAFLLLAPLLAFGGCGHPVPPVPPVVEVQGVRQVFAVPPGGQDGGVVAALRTFADGRMDALHVALPPGPAMNHLASLLRLDGVAPRKLRRDPLLAAGTVVAVRYIALVLPCPALDLTGAAFGANTTRPGFGCATLADLAAQTSDPADLLGNDATFSPDPERAAAPVARWRGFAAGGAALSGSPSTQTPTGATGR